MSAKTKIVVLHKKEVFYAGLFTAAGLFLILLFLILFLPGQEQEVPSPDEAQTESDINSGPTNTGTTSTGTTSPASTQASSRSGVLQENLPVSSYTPGVYKTELILGGQSVEVEAILEKDRIASLRLVNLDEAVTTMYPLLEPTMEHICAQVYETQSLEQLDTDTSAKYTSLVLLEAIRCCIEKGTQGH